MLSSVPNINPRRPHPSSISLKAGLTLPLHIEKLLPGGMALTRYEGHIILCPGGIPGEEVLLEIVGRRKGVWMGKLLYVRVPSSSRVKPECGLVGRCGGCDFQHLNYGEQLSQKQGLLEDSLRRIGKFSEPHVSPVLPSPHPLGYRQVLRLSVVKRPGGRFLGFFELGTRDLVPVKHCLLVNAEFQSLISQLSERLSQTDLAQHLLREVEIRYSGLEDRYLVIVRGQPGQSAEIQALFRVLGEGSEEAQKVKGWIYEAMPQDSGHSRSWGSSKFFTPLIRGADHFWEHFNGLRLKIHYRSFMQANWALFEDLGKMLLEWMGEGSGKNIIELYAGTGSLGLSLAQHGGRVTCVELNEKAVEDAKESIRVNQIKGCRVRGVAVESYLSSLREGSYDAVLLDPPRTGLRPKVLEQLGKLRIPKLWYLSCDGPTLARDLRTLCDQGYALSRIQPFDMFPQTAHVETLVELTR